MVPQPVHPIPNQQEPTPASREELVARHALALVQSTVLPDQIMTVTTHQNGRNLKDATTPVAVVVVVVEVVVPHQLLPELAPASVRINLALEALLARKIIATIPPRVKHAVLMAVSSTHFPFLLTLAFFSWTFPKNN